MKKVFTFLVVLGVIYFGIYFWLRRSPDIPSSVDSAHVVFLKPYSMTKTADVRINDSVKISAILEVLRSGVAISEHKCASVGMISFDGEESFSIGVLPGHNTDYYEFRHDGRIFRVSRKIFIDVLTAAGVKEIGICIDGHPSENAEQGAAGNPLPAE